MQNTQYDNPRPIYLYSRCSGNDGSTAPAQRKALMIFANSPTVKNHDNTYSHDANKSGNDISRQMSVIHSAPQNSYIVTTTVSRFGRIKIPSDPANDPMFQYYCDNFVKLCEIKNITFVVLFGQYDQRVPSNGWNDYKPEIISPSDMITRMKNVYDKNIKQIEAPKKPKAKKQADPKKPKRNRARVNKKQIVEDRDNKIYELKSQGKTTKEIMEILKCKKTDIYNANKRFKP